VVAASAKKRLSSVDLTNFQLVRKVNWLMAEILKKGGKVADFKGLSTKKVVEGACELLKNIIGIQNSLIEPVYYPLKPYELSYYRNQVIHMFISESNQ